MEVRSRGFQNLGGNRDADRVYNPELKELLGSASTGAVAGDGITSTSSSAVMDADVTGLDATPSGTTGTETGTVPGSSFTFPPLTSDLKSAPPEAQYPNFSSFGDPVSSQQPSTESNADGETEQVTQQEDFDDMVVLKDGMVTSASLSDGGLGDAFEQFESSDPHEPQGETLVRVDQQPLEIATIPVTELPEAFLKGTTSTLTEEIASVLKPTGTTGGEIGSEAPPMEGGNVEEVPPGVQPSVQEQPGPVEAYAPGVAVEPETTLTETPFVIVAPTETGGEGVLGNEFPSEASEKPTEGVDVLVGELPSEKSSQVDHTAGSELPSDKDPGGEQTVGTEVPSVKAPEAEGDHAQEVDPAADRKEVSEQDVQAIKGQKVLKKFGKKDYLGDVTDYDLETKWFKVVYEDGDEEDLELDEVRLILIAPGSLPASSSEKKRPRTEGGVGEDGKKSSKKAKKIVAETPKVQQGSKTKRKKVSKSPARSKSPGTTVKSSKKSSVTKKPRSPAKQEKKVESKLKSEEVMDSPSFKTPGKSQTKGKKRIRTASSKGSKRVFKTSSSKKKQTKGQSLKSPVKGLKFEDTPKRLNTGSKRKAEVVDTAESKVKRLRKGVGEEETVALAQEIVRVGEATFIGKPIRKDFDGTLYNGVVVNYDVKTKFFKVKYDDDDQEDLEWRELEPLLVPEGKSDVDTEAKPVKVSSLSTLMSQSKKAGSTSAKTKKAGAASAKKEKASGSSAKKKKGASSARKSSK